MSTSPVVKMLLLVAVVQAAGVAVCTAARILCASHQFGSHLLMVHTAAEGLLARGHEVYTILSDKMPVPQGLEEKGFKILKYHTPEDSKICYSAKKANTTMEAALSNKYQNLTDTSTTCLTECLDLEADQKVMDQIEQLQFDLMLIVTRPYSNCMLFLPLRYNVPYVIVISVLEMEPYRSPLLPAYMPHFLLEFSDKMSFLEKVVNTVVSVYWSIPAINGMTALSDTSLITKYNTDPEVSTWFDVSRRAELVLVTRGPILEYPVPLMPNVIEIECLTCRPANPLSPSLEEAVAAATSGIIVVSFGTLIHFVPDVVAQKLLSAFSHRQEVVFWRYKGKTSVNIPDNVKVMDWLPQNDLLAHPKTKLFITHAGNNGQYEAVYHGVPMLAFPLFSDQFHNAHRIVEHRFGLRCDITNFTSEEMVNKMSRIIDSDFYRKRVEKAGNILKSLPMNGQEKATYWLEHVLMFGSDHLHSSAINLPWYSYYMFDMIILAELIIFTLVCLLIVTVKAIIQRFYRVKTKQKRE